MRAPPGPRSRTAAPIAASATSMSSGGAVMVVASRLVVPCFACMRAMAVRRVAAFHHVAAAAAVHVQVDEAGQDVVVALPARVGAPFAFDGARRGHRRQGRRRSSRRT
jgi:hypothetical protein